jgi:hypothetical protein
MSTIVVQNIQPPGPTQIIHDMWKSRADAVSSLILGPDKNRDLRGISRKLSGDKTALIQHLLCLIKKFMNDSG